VAHPQVVAHFDPPAALKHRAFDLPAKMSDLRAQPAAPLVGVPDDLLDSIAGRLPVIAA